MTNAYACNVVIDLEFTHVPKALRQTSDLFFEIIEVGAVKLAADGSVVGEFSRMVKPTLASGVAPSVHRITGICDEDLIGASTLPVVLDELAAWIGTGRTRMVTWSPSDLAQVTAECRSKGIDAALPHRWLDIQRLYPRLMGMPKRSVALDEAADWCGIANDKASAHRALYDARMTAELFRMMAAGDLSAQRAALAAQVHARPSDCSASIGSACGGLAQLLASLHAQEGLAA